MFIQGSPAEAAAKGERGGRISFSLPPRIAVYNDWYQAASARAMRQPEAFARAFYANIPRAFFVFLPLFALFLELLYRKQGYWWITSSSRSTTTPSSSSMFSLLFLARMLAPLLPGFLDLLIALVLIAWLLAYLPVALRRVYGGSRLVTGAKLVTLGMLYSFSFATSMPLLMGAALLQF